MRSGVHCQLHWSECGICLLLVTRTLLLHSHTHTLWPHRRSVSHLLFPLPFRIPCIALSIVDLRLRFEACRLSFACCPCLCPCVAIFSFWREKMCRAKFIGSAGCDVWFIAILVPTVLALLLLLSLLHLPLHFQFQLIVKSLACPIITTRVFFHSVEWMGC